LAATSGGTGFPDPDAAGRFFVDAGGGLTAGRVPEAGAFRGAPGTGDFGPEAAPGAGVFGPAAGKPGSFFVPPDQSGTFAGCTGRTPPEGVFLPPRGVPGDPGCWGSKGSGS
jgi:hypothetical protein